jgi:hypothetical protein
MGGVCSKHVEMRNTYRILVEKPQRQKPFERLVVDGGMILKSILGKQNFRVWSGFIWFRTGTSRAQL